MKVNPLIIGLFLVFFLSSQVESFAFNNSEGLKPKWITQTLPKSKSGTYFFIRGHGEGATLASAKQQAFVSMSLMIEQEHGLTVNTSIRISERLSQSQSFSRNEYQQEIVMDVTENGHLLKIVCREIDEYWELTDSHYSVDVLYAVIDKNTIGTSYDDIITVTSKYGAVGFLSIIPGAGQFYKGSIRKGGIILGGEILAAGGIVLCENTRSAYVKKMVEQPKHASEYNSLADSWETGRNVFIGIAVAVYVYNLIDAFITTGAKHIIIQGKKTTIAAVPHVGDNCVGMGLALSF